MVMLQCTARLGRCCMRSEFTRGSGMRRSWIQTEGVVRVMFVASDIQVMDGLAVLVDASGALAASWIQRIILKTT